MAFMEDLCQDIEKAISTGDSIILLIDGNEDMQLGTLAQALSKLHLWEVITEKHGRQATVNNNNNNNSPIDGIWCSNQFRISAAGYLPFEALLPNTNHRGIYVDISFEVAFGTNMPWIVRRTMRQLNCADLRRVENFISWYKKSIMQQDLLRRRKY